MLDGGRCLSRQDRGERLTRIDHGRTSPLTAPFQTSNRRRLFVLNIIWVVVIGFAAGIIARILSPGPNNPSGFILTVVLGVVGAF